MSLVIYETSNSVQNEYQLGPILSNQQPLVLSSVLPDV